MKKDLKSKLSDIKHLFLINPKLRTFVRSAVLLLFFGKNPDKILLKNSIKLHAPNNHPLIEMVSEIFLQNVYTPNENFDIGTKDVVVDIGANIGIFTVMAAKKTRRRVYAFEPFKHNLYYLRKNLLKNGLMNVVVNEIAVCGDIGHKNLFLMNNPAGHILENKKFEGKNASYIKVSTITLQAIIDINKLRQIDFLKIDCEGSEGDIFSSTPKNYLRKIKRAAIEFHDNVSSLKHNEIQKLLEEAGFTTRLTWDGISPFGFIYAYF